MPKPPPSNTIAPKPATFATTSKQIFSNDAPNFKNDSTMQPEPEYSDDDDVVFCPISQTEIFENKKIIFDPTSKQNSLNDVSHSCNGSTLSPETADSDEDEVLFCSTSKTEKSNILFQKFQSQGRGTKRSLDMQEINYSDDSTDFEYSTQEFASRVPQERRLKIKSLNCWIGDCFQKFHDRNHLNSHMLSAHKLKSHRCQQANCNKSYQNQ